MNTLDEITERLVDHIASLGSVVVAFSGGVDSSVVAAAATRAFGSSQSDQHQRCLAVTACSPSLASWQSELAVRVAGEIGIAHEFVSTNEQSREGYRRNETDRCFFCKQTLYEFLQPIAAQRNAVILSGTNSDDLGDHRPGIQAGKDASVQTPLADLHIDKATVRQIAHAFGLSNFDLPASPCLASRIEYQVEVTPERLAMIDRAESWLREHGLADLRVRLHTGGLARIEIPTDSFDKFMRLQTESGLNDAFLAFGFRYVTLDLAGLRSGSMNEGFVQISSSVTITPSSTTESTS